MLLVKNVFLYDPASGAEKKTDILMDKGRFVKIEEGISPGEISLGGAAENASTLRVIDGEGLCAAPGLIDTHAHFRDPGYLWKEDLHTGSLAAARGGYTSIILMANTNPTVDCVPVLSDILERGKKEKIHLYSCANVTMHMGGRETVDFDALAGAGAAGFTDDGVPVMDAEILEQLRILGLDYSQENFYVDSEGRKANYPHFYRKSENRLAREQRKLSRMTKGSSNYQKQLKKVQRKSLKIRNQRKDFINKEALKLSREYDAVAVEDLDLRKLSKSLSLGKKLHDNGFGQFRTKLENKLRDKGSVLVRVDRYYPSTKTCHCCGAYHPGITLGIKTWTCPNCGTNHDRDENAAINIRKEGIRIFADYYKAVLKKEELAEMMAIQRSEYRHRKRG